MIYILGSIVDVGLGGWLGFGNAPNDKQKKNPPWLGILHSSWLGCAHYTKFKVVYLGLGSFVTAVSVVSFFLVMARFLILERMKCIED